MVWSYHIVLIKFVLYNNTETQMKVAYWAFAATACILSASCGGEQQERKSEEIQKVTTDSITGTGKMQSSNISDTVTVRGTTYRYKIVRKADEELGKINGRKT